MIIISVILMTILTALWLFTLSRADEEDVAAGLMAELFDSREAIRRQTVKRYEYKQRLERYNRYIQSCFAAFLSGREEREAKKLNRYKVCLETKTMPLSKVFILPGYVLQRQAEKIGKSVIRKTIYLKCFELYGEKYADYKASQIFAKILSYPVIGMCCVLLLGIIMFALDQTRAGLAILVIGIALTAVGTYGIFDELGDAVKKRRALISRQFPNVISKLALLVTSGMIMDRAWKETANSQDTELYKEMCSTSKELDNLVSPEEAFGRFISRCNTKETAKLASAIMQNLSKGNAEIGRLLKDMAHEVWQERRHSAKRDAEKANSKLMIPTMLLFLAILVMLMVPIAMNFSGI